jgi:hypothetical protein
MAKSTTGQSERTRPSSRLQPQSLLESTPVLFRLPSIQLNILAGTEEYGNEEGQTTADRHSTREENSPSLLRVYAEASQEVETSNLTGKQSKDSAEDRILKTDSAIGSHSATDTLSDSKSSWWEHWSSGVVVILIAIATLTVILLFVRSSGNSAQSSFRSQSLEDEFGDLEFISVPTFEMVTPGGMTASVTEPSDERTQSVSKSDEYSELAAQLASADVSSQNVSILTVPSKDNDGQVSPAPSTDKTADSEMPSNQLIMAAGIPSQNDATSGLATAQLLEPTPLLDSPQPREPAASFPFETTESSLASQFPELPETGSHYSGSPETGSLLSTTQLTSSMPNLSGQQSSVPTAATAVSAKQPVGEAASQARPEVRATATPDSNEEEIIRAYLELTRADRNSGSSSTEAVNRYQGIR